MSLFAIRFLKDMQWTVFSVCFVLAVMFLVLPNSVFALHNSTITLQTPSTLDCSGVNSRVHLDWSTTNTHGSTNYFVERKLSGDPPSSYTQIAGPLSGVSYIDATATSGTSYSYRIRGEQSSTILFSNEITVTSEYCAAEILTPTTSCATDGPHTSLSWNAASGNVTTYEIYRDTVKIGETTNTTFDDNQSLGLTGTTAYDYFIRTVWQGGTQRDSTTAAVTAPACPAFLQVASQCVSSAAPGGPQINLTWNSLLGIQEYELYRQAPGDSNPVLLQGGLTGTTFDDNLVTSLASSYFQSGTIDYYVKAIWPNASQADSTTQQIAIPQCQPFLDVGTNCQTVEFQLSWTGTQGATHYNVYRDSTFVTQINHPTFAFNDGTSQIATHTYRVDGIAGATTLASNEVTKNIDCTVVTPPAPDPILNPLVAQCSAGDSEISLSWSASNNVNYYSVFRSTPSTAAQNIANPTTTSYLDDGVNSGIDYTYYIIANGQSGTQSNPSNAENIVAVSCVQPTQPGISLLSQCSAGAPNVTVSWTSDDGNTLRYVVSRSSDGGSTFPFVVGTFNQGDPEYSSKSVQDLTVSSSATYHYKVVAEGPLGVPVSESVVSSTTTLSCAPDTPALLASNMCVSGSPNVDLSWSVGSQANIDHFEIFRDGAPLSHPFLGPGATAYSDTTVSPTTSYTYRIDAVSPIGVRSSSSDTPVTTNSCTAPGSFTLSLDQAPFCAGPYLRADLSWTASSGVTSYNMEQNRVSPAQTTTYQNVTSSLQDIGLGKALNFDGSKDYVDVLDNDILDPSAITVSAWVLPDSAGSNGGGNIVAKGGNSGYRFRINSSDSKITWFDRGGTNALTSNASILFGSWTHIAVTGDASGLKIYINGALDNSNSTSYGGSNTTDSLKIGGETAFSEYFDGRIDEVHVYNRALNTTEIGQLYTGTVAQHSGIVGLWHFDEGTGQIASDSSNNNNNGILGGSTASNSKDPSWGDSGMQYVSSYDWQAEAINIGGSVFSTPDSNPTQDPSVARQAPMCVPPKTGVALTPYCDVLLGAPVIDISFSYSINTTSYEVYREEGAVDTLVGSIGQATDPATRVVTDNNAGAGLTPLTSYSYYVIAKRNAAAVGGDTVSDTIQTTTINCNIPTTPQNLQVVFECTGGGVAPGTSPHRASFSWEDSDNTDYYQVYRDGSPLAGTITDNNNATYTFFDDTIAVATFYAYSVAAFGVGGRSASPDPFVDLDPALDANGNYCRPSAPSAFVTTQCQSGSPVNTVSWTDAHPFNTQEYQVYRNGNLVQTTSATSWQDTTSLLANTSYNYEVKAIGPNPPASTSLESVLSSVAPVSTLACGILPNSITDLQVTQNQCVLGNPQITLDWSDTTNAVSYDVYRNSSLVYQNRWHPFVDSGSNALDFSGSVANGGSGAYVSVSNPVALEGNQYTLAAWVYPENIAGDNDSGIISKNSGSNNERYHLGINGGGGINVRVNGSGAGRLDTAVGTVVNNQWQHLVGRYDGSTITAHLNGVEVGSKAFSDSINSSNADLVFGRRTDDRRFTGRMDEVRIYNRALSNQEIQDLANGIPVSPVGLIGMWHFDEGSGGTVKDDSGNGKTGVLRNGTSWTQLFSSDATYDSGPLQESTTYTYTVRARGVDTQSGDSNIVSPTSASCAPADPNLRVSPDCSGGGSGLLLEWDSDVNTDYWTMYKKLNATCIPEDSTFTYLPPTTSDLDNDVQSGATYEYCAEAVGPSTSTFSASVAAVAPFCANLPYDGDSSDINIQVAAQCSGASSRMIVMWDADSTGNTVSYNVLRQDDPAGGGPFVTVASGLLPTTTSYTDTTGIIPANEYVYRVEAVGSGPGSTISQDSSPPVAALDCQSTPPVPAGLCDGSSQLPVPCLVIVSKGNQQAVSLSWTDSSNEYDDPDIVNKAGYRVFRDGSPPNQLINSMQGGDLSFYSFVDNGLADNTSYSYQIRSYNDNTNPYVDSSNLGGVFSNILNITVPIAQPGDFDLAGSPVGNTIQLSWAQSNTTAAGSLTNFGETYDVRYEVFRGPDEFFSTSGLTPLCTVTDTDYINPSVPLLQCVDTNPDPAERWYRVVATNGGGSTESDTEQLILIVFPEAWREISPF